MVVLVKYEYWGGRETGEEKIANMHCKTVLSFEPENPLFLQLFFQKKKNDEAAFHVLRGSHVLSNT